MPGQGVELQAATDRRLTPNWRSAIRLLCSLLNFNQPPSLDLPFPVHEIARFHLLTKTEASTPVDEQSWKDLQLGSYLNKLSPELSIFGQQSLHKRLRDGADDKHLKTSRERIQNLVKDPTLLAKLYGTCLPLRETATEISQPLFGGEPQAPPLWLPLLRWLPLLTLTTVLLSFVSLYALIAVALASTMLLTLQLHMHQTIVDWKDVRVSLQKLLATYGMLGKVANSGKLPMLQTFQEGQARASIILRKLTPSPYIYALPLLSTYADWVFLVNIRHYFHARLQFQLHRDFLQQCFIETAELEADIAIARHLALTSQFCWSDQTKESGIKLEDMINPLLTEAAPVSLGMQGQGIFLSGQNGVGKSTLLRSLGLNLVVARAFGFCYAKRADVPALAVHTSMQIEDSLETGESLYMAELRRASELLTYARSGRPCCIIIDEIFRGTNHLEGISAAAAVLHSLATEALLIASSHNLVLAPLLAGHLQPCYLQRPVHPQNSGVQLDLLPGVLPETNGIALLASSNFDADIQAKAGKVHAWLSDYLLSPTQVPVLSECQGRINT